MTSKPYLPVQLYKTSEYCNWFEQINIYISNKLKEDILNARRTLWGNKHSMEQIFIAVPDGFLHQQCKQRMHQACRFNHFIAVYDLNLDYFVQSYWSEMVFAKYDLSLLFPHPMKDENIFF